MNESISYHQALRQQEAGKTIVVLFKGDYRVCPKMTNKVVTIAAGTITKNDFYVKFWAFDALNEALKFIARQTS